jgi:hypothetical protein
MQKPLWKPVYYVSFDVIKDRITYFPWDENCLHISSRFDHILIYDPKRKKELKINPSIIQVIERLKPFKKHLLAYTF